MSNVAQSTPASWSPVRLLTANPTLALFLVSALGLFLELLLIRWIGTEIRVFALLQNTVLVVCFLGLGMGCWDARGKPFALRDVLIPLSVVVALLSVPTTRHVLGEVTTAFSGFGDLMVWKSDDDDALELYKATAFGLALTFLLMVLMWEMFVPFGRLLGRLMDENPNLIRAYSANVAGSLAGIWAFVAASALQLPPVGWFAVFAAVALLFRGTGGKSQALDVVLLVGIVALSAAASYQSGYQETHWSPYQKLAVRYPDAVAVTGQTRLERTLRGERTDAAHTQGTFFIAVNNHAFQAMRDLRPETVRADPERFPPNLEGYSQYDLPVRFHPNPKAMLVVGAGSGNDAAGGLRNGLRRVVAVEIDPAVIALGGRLHKERPYADPRCVVVNDDARSYFATTAETFDVISFGLLDSHTSTSMTNTRLDNYVYTAESIEHARKLLNPGGVLTLSFTPERPFIADRLNGALARAFGHAPVAFVLPQSGFGGGHLMFAVGDREGAIRERLAADPRLGELVESWRKNQPVEFADGVRPATDDWPYLYLERPMIPVLYYLLAGLLAALFVYGVVRLGVRGAAAGWGGGGWHFFFLGAGFMLLEVQNISKAAVVLGNTWVVNAVIISGVMVMILLANLAAARFPRLPLTPVYALLVLSCVGLYFLDLSTFAFLPYATKAVVVGLLTSLPMFFSGIVFVRSFAAARRKDSALGANLIGALVGGLLQSVTFVTGIKALLLIVAALYLAAVLTRPKQAAEVEPA
jgi:spermidine synthase